MNATQIVDSLLGDEDVEAIAKPTLNTPYAHALDAYRRELDATKDPRRAWAAAIQDGFQKYGHAVPMAAFQLDQAVQEIRNLGLNRNPRQVQGYMDHVVTAAVELLNLSPSQSESVKLMFRRLALA